MGETVQYRNMLLEYGFNEATWNPLHFWKKLTDKTAFIINLKELQHGVGVVYGLNSTAGAWGYIMMMGSNDCNCNLRRYMEIHTENDAIVASNTIGALYQEYLHVDKDTILANIKELRKQFISQINNVLKPLGFRKKGNQWSKKLSDSIVLQFWADKGSYSDLYYFQISIYPLASPVGSCCYSQRLDTQGTDIFDWKKASQPHLRFDWQLQSTDDLLEIINRACEQELKLFLENDLKEIGKQPFVSNKCFCDRKSCANCWVEKNFWEAKEC